MSLPAWGEWIEILSVSIRYVFNKSLPAWGEWIEITVEAVTDIYTIESLPAWGEWIEISICFLYC